MSTDYDDWVIVISKGEDAIRDGVPFNVATKMVWLIEGDDERECTLGDMVVRGVRVVLADELLELLS